MSVHEKDDHEECESSCDVQLLSGLLNRQLEPLNWMIPNLLPPGLCVLGGKSKAGKSWFVLNLCLAVSEGSPVFGYFECVPQKVLYLALEDNERRVQHRSKEILGNLSVSDNFLYSTSWLQFPSPGKSIEMDGLSRLAEMIYTQHVKLIVIDTWQRVRPQKRGRDDYEEDYAHLAQIQKLALANDCAVILVHHTRKDNSGDEKQDSLLGSTAIAGASDLIWILERKQRSNLGIITPSGKDIEDETPMEFNFNGRLWRYQGLSTDSNFTDNQLAVLEVLSNSDTTLSRNDIVQISGVKSGSIGRALESLKTKGSIEQVEKGKYKYCATMQFSKDII